MIYTYMIKTYALLVKGGRYSLEQEEGKKIVPKAYQIPVAEYLTEQEA